MADRTKIEWTDATWNPLRGCTRKSAGCLNCYAEPIAARFSGEGQPFHGFVKRVDGQPRWTGRVGLAGDLEQPLRWRKPRRIFVNSMSDTFHEALQADQIAYIFAVMIAAHRLRGHVFQVLTKRPARMATLLHTPEFWRLVNRYVETYLRDFDDFGPQNPPPGIWLGASIEDQATADERIPALLRTPAALRFLSCEPLLGPITLQTIYDGSDIIKPLAGVTWYPTPPDWPTQGITARHSHKIHWVIAGGESGRNARPMHQDWVRWIRDQCAAAGVPFFFKQWGEWVPLNGAVNWWEIDDNLEASRFDHLKWYEDEHSWSIPFRPLWCDFSDGNLDREQTVARIGKRRAGRTLDGITHDAFPEPRHG